MARKRRVQTITLFPNPYHCMGKDGALGGAVPQPEPFHGGALPVRAYIGAQRRAENITMGPEGRESRFRADIFFVFDVQAKEYEVPPELRADFAALVRDEAVFAVKDLEEVPVQKLAAARAKLVIEHALHHTGEDPDFAFWAEQFPLDEQIETISKPIVEAKLAPLQEQVAATPTAVADDAEELIKRAQERTRKAIEAISASPTVSVSATHEPQNGAPAAPKE